MVRSASLLFVVVVFLRGAGAIRPENRFRYQDSSLELPERDNCKERHVVKADRACGVLKIADLKAGCYKAVCRWGISASALPWLMKEVQQTHLNFPALPPLPPMPSLPGLETTTTTTPIVVIVLEIQVGGIDFVLLDADAQLKSAFEVAMRKAISDGMDIDLKAVECHLTGTGAGGSDSMQVSVGHDSVSVLVEAKITPPPRMLGTFVQEFHAEEKAIDEIIALEISAVPGIEAVSRGEPEVVTNETEVEMPPLSAATSWGMSFLNKVCGDPETCGAYHNERCRDAFCAGCSSGPCETLEEAQRCCLENADCSAVYGGGAHWWTFNAPCAEEGHANYYNVWHRGGEQPPTQPPTQPPATPAPPQPTQAPPQPGPAPPGLDVDFPAGLLVCNSGPPAIKTACSGNLGALNSRVRSVVTAHFNTLSSSCNDDSCPRGDLAGCLVRLAGHDVMDFNPSLNNGGADGCIDFADPDNMGLKGCMLSTVNERDSSNVSLESMWQEFCQEVSAADFFVIAAEALMSITVPTQQRSKWTDSFTNNFRFGRQTALECSPEPLPNPAHSCDAVEDVFVNRMGLSWTQATALMGVHTLGRALVENSGYDGFWVSQEHARSFTPEYYNRIVGVGWSREETSKGKFQWKRDDRALQGEMMLNTDMCLAFQSGGTAPLTRAEDANHTGCCLWKDSGDADMADVICNCQGNALSEGCTHSNCCKSSRSGCAGNDPFRRFMRGRSASSVESYDAVIKYAKTATGFDAWHDDFHPTWLKVTTQGHELC